MLGLLANPHEDWGSRKMTPIKHRRHEEQIQWLT
jgi:hypothetical protein